MKKISWQRIFRVLWALIPALGWILAGFYSLAWDAGGVPNESLGGSYVAQYIAASLFAVPLIIFCIVEGPDPSQGRRKMMKTSTS